MGVYGNRDGLPDDLIALCWPGEASMPEREELANQAAPDGIHSSNRRHMQDNSSRLARAWPGTPVAVVDNRD